MSKLLRNVRGFVVFSALAINTIFWSIPLLTLALVKFLIPWNALRRLVTRLGTVMDVSARRSAKSFRNIIGS